MRSFFLTENFDYSVSLCRFLQESCTSHAWLVPLVDTDDSGVSKVVEDTTDAVVNMLAVQDGGC